MSDNIIVQYVGIEAKALAREYTFTVREGGAEPREFILIIANEAFDSHRVRYQDAPDLCSRTLQHELAAYDNHPPITLIQVTDSELDDYRVSHTPKSSRR